MSTAQEITGGLGINYETVVASLNTLKSKGKVKATDSSPTKYAFPPKKPIKVDNGQDFWGHVDRLNRENQEPKAENNCMRAELNECRRKLARLVQRIVRQNIYGNN